MASVTEGTQAPVAPPAAQPGTAHEELPGVTSQLVRVLSPPRPVATGTYTLKVSLHPESLGAVQATVTAGDARLSVHLVASTSDGELAIRQGLSELHEALSSGGQQATVTVSGGGSSGAGSSGGGPGQRPAGTFTGAGTYGGGTDGSGRRGAPAPREGVRPLGGADRVTSGAIAQPVPVHGGRSVERLVDVHV